MFTLPSNRRDLLQCILALDVTLQQPGIAPDRRARLHRFQRVLTALASSGAFLPRPLSGGSARPPERKAE